MKTAFSVILPVFLALPAYPQETISIEEIIKEVINKNPEIKAAEKLYEAYKNRIPQSYFPANPSVEFERMYLPDSGEKNVLVKQELENPYKLLLMRSVYKKDADYYKKLYQARINEIISQTRKAFYGYFLATRYEKIFQETADLLRGFSKIAEVKYSVGHGQQIDALKAHVELSKTLNMLVTIKQEKETSRALLNVLMDREPENPLADPEDLEKKALESDFQTLRAKAIDLNPEIKAHKIEIDRSHKMLKLGRASWLPDFMFAYRTRSAMGSSMDNTYDISFGLSIPLFFTRNNSIIRQAGLEKQMAEAEYRAFSNKVSFELKDSFVKAQTNLRLIELYETSVLPQAEQALKIAQTSYQANNIDFIDLLDSVRTYLEFKMDYYAYIAEYNSWRAELEKLLGEKL